MANLVPEWSGVKLFISGINSEQQTPNYQPLCKGIKSITPRVNEQNQQAFYMCGNGGANNVVTGIAPEYDVSGDRVIGDAAQDYICSLRYMLGSGRDGSVKVELYDPAGVLIQTITADCTITDIVDFGSDATALVPFSCKIRINGIPTVTLPTPPTP